ncbi:hypothetical protein [Candidatus Regiella insecticola]|uniref:hypothetical protein n=1 Tax=Candidatus Regiella insecticola TaxID=138073 RepID=UPI001596C9DC|nr:hypothetical protein [Candidatus Regiella insecticola]
MASAAAEQSTIELIQKNAQGQSEITIDGQKTVLPKWMRLQLGDTAYNDTIEGDDSNNTLSSVQGNDSLKGKAGIGLLSNSFNDVIMDNQGQNTLKLFGDITLDNLRTRVVGDNIHLIFPALDGRGNDDESHLITMSYHGGNSVEIAGQSYTLEALLAGTSLRLEGDEGDNRINGGIGDDVIAGGAGHPSRNTLDPLTQAMSSFRESGQQPVGSIVLPALNRQPPVLSSTPL